MDSRWYVGESRADELLDFALAQLARRAHLVDPERYLRVKKLLESRIPLWVEERRGPLDKRGYPLYSLEGYRDFIEWWVKLLTAPVGGETTMKGGFVQELFGRRDPTARVFGAGVVGAAEAEEQKFGIGATRVQELKAFCLEYLRTLIGTHAGEPGVVDAVNQIMAAIVPIIESWADESKAPVDPETGTPYPLIVGAGQMERMREAIKVMLEELVRTKLANLPARTFGTQGQGAWPYYGQTMPAVSTAPVLQKWAGEFGQTGGVAPTLGQWSFQDLVKQRGDDAKIAYEIMSANWARGWTAQQIGTAVNQVLDTWAGGTYSVGATSAANPLGEMDAATMQRYNGELAQLKNTVVGLLNAGG